MGNLGDLVPPGEDAIIRRIEKLERRIRELSGQDPFKPAGIEVEPNLVRVVGDFETTGDTTIGGNAAITGTLSLPAGIIDNEALASPLTQRSNYGNSSAFAIASAPGAVLASFTVTVPAGYTKASYIAEGAAGVHNLTGSNNFAYLRVFASGPSGYITWGSRQNVEIGSGTVRTAAALLVRAVDVPLTGGDVLTFWCEVYADTGMASSGSNFASGAALVTFTR